MRILYLAPAVLLVASCASTGIPESSEVMNAVGRQFAGRPFSEMMARYGAPARSMTVGEETVYSWEKADTIHYQTQAPLAVRCQLDAYVKQDGTVRTVGLSGQQGACPAFIP